MLVTRSTKYNAHETERMRQVHGAELATFSRRAIAFAVDFAIGALLFMLPIVLYALSSGGVRSRVSFGEPREDVTFRLTFFDNPLSVLWWVVYFGLATYIGHGKTPGKWLMGIRVVSLVHERISLWHSIERALGYAASALEFGFGFVQYFIHPNRRTVHDRIAETIVVREPKLKLRPTTAARPTTGDRPTTAARPATDRAEPL